MATPVMELEDVSLTLEGNAGPVNILRGITLDLARGETLGLVGPSGSGKSSLLMLMAGLETATAGRITALGHDLTALGEDALARFRRDHMGVVFQSFHLIPTMTAIENVATPLELAGHPDAFDRAADELDAMGLATRLEHYPAQLSGGEQQRVALARAAVSRPGDPPRRRADRQPRRRDRGGDHRPALRAPRPARRDAGAGHPRPRARPALRPGAAPAGRRAGALRRGRGVIPPPDGGAPASGGLKAPARPALGGRPSRRPPSGEGPRVGTRPCP